MHSNDFVINKYAKLEAVYGKQLNNRNKVDFLGESGLFFVEK